MTHKAVVATALVLASSAVLFVQSAARADCAGSYVQAWPENGATQFPTNGSVLVHLGPSNPARFDPTRITLHRVRDDRLVPLRVVVDRSVNAAYLGRRTLVLTPAQPLDPSTSYSLRIAFDRAVAQTFTTAAGPDTSAPTLAAATSGLYREVEYGCGPARSVPIALSGMSDGNAPAPWVHIRVARTSADLRAGRLLGEIIEPVGADGGTSIGHDMCDGGWPLAPGDTLVLGVSALDRALHESPMRETIARAIATP